MPDKITPIPSMNRGNPASEIRKAIDYKKSVDEKIASGEMKVSEKKNELAEKLGGIMQDAGFDPGKLEDVGKFINMLNKKNPDLVDIFKTIFESISVQGGNAQEMPPTEEGGQITDESIIPELR